VVLAFFVSLCVVVDIDCKNVYYRGDEFEMVKRNIFDIFLNIVIILLSLIVIYWAFQLIFGGSPELSQFNSVLIILLGGLFIKVYREVGVVEVEMKHVSLDVKHGFNNMKKDMNLIRKDLNLIKGKLK